MRLIMFVFIFFLILNSLVSATVFQSDTEIRQDSITYVFVKGLSLKSFDILSYGVRLGDDTLRLNMQGGDLKVFIYDWSDDGRNVGFSSSVPQTLTFALRKNGVDYYFYDGVKYSINNYDIGLGFVNGSFRSLTNSTGVVYSPTVSTPWYKINFFTLEVNQQVKEGIIYGDVVGLSYFKIFLFIFLLFFLFIIFRWFS